MFRVLGPPLRQQLQPRGGSPALLPPPSPSSPGVPVHPAGRIQDMVAVLGPIGSRIGVSAGPSVAFSGKRLVQLGLSVCHFTSAAQAQLCSRLKHGERAPPPAPPESGRGKAQARAPVPHRSPQTCAPPLGPHPVPRACALQPLLFPGPRPVLGPPGCGLGPGLFLVSPEAPSSSHFAPGEVASGGECEISSRSQHRDSQPSSEGCHTLA